MKRRGVDEPPPEMPASLRVFDVSVWPSRQVWTQARVAWCETHGADFVDVLRRDAAHKRALAASSLSAGPGIPPGSAANLPYEQVSN